MALHLYDMVHSPYCAAIRCAMGGLGLKWETIWIDNWDRGPVIVATAGAYYQVPLLVDDGVAVFPGSAEAKEIQQYLNDKYANGRLIPEGNRLAQELVTEYIEDTLEGAVFKLGDPAYVDSIPDLIARTNVVRHKERRFGVGCIERWRRERNQLRAEADALLARFEQALTAQPFLFGDAPVYADYALWGVLFNMTYDNRSTLNGNQAALADFQRRLADYRY
jgi:glutathione S-transferase